jgi:hypothetical protein
MNTQRNQCRPDVPSTKALNQIRRDVEAIQREEELRSLAADGVIMDEDDNDIDGLRAAEKELKDLLDELGRGDDWEKIRYEACRRFPFKEYKNVPPPSRLPGLNSAKRPP